MNPDNPFAPVCTRQTFLETAGADDALRRLEAGMGAREPFLLLIGEPGTGKTTLAHEAVARWDPVVATAFIAYPALSGAELLEEVVRRFGGEPPAGASRPRLMAWLERSLADIVGRGQVAMVVVDDAHTLSPESLEELRLLVNASQQAGQPLEVLLVGLPSLESMLDAPVLAALKQRVSVHARLEPLSAGETRRYIRHRVAAAGGDGSSLFPRRACADIAALSGGVPRRVNALAAEALRLASAAGEPMVGPEHVRAAAAAMAGSLPPAALRELDDADDADDDDDAGTPDAAAAARMPAKPAAPARAARKAAVPPVAPAPAPVAAPPAVSPAAAVPAPPPTRTPARAEAPVAIRHDAPEPAEASRPAPPASHDPGEWVARFIGDRGPVVIGSQAMAPSAAWEPLEHVTEDSAGLPAEPPARRAVPARPPARPRPHAGRGRVIAVALAACVAVAAIVPLMRAWRAATSRPGSAATVATSTAPAAGAEATSPAPALKERPGAARSGASGAGPAAEAPPRSPTGRYTMEVGRADDLQTALDERGRLEELTGIEGWVVPAREGTGEPHRIVIGVYRSYERASAAARMLLATRTLDAVRVVALPRRSARR